MEIKMRKGFVVREKGYEYNDNWYDHDPSQDNYTHLFDDVESATKYAKEFTVKFLSGRSVYDFFNEQPYLSNLKDILGEDNDEFKSNYDIEGEEFSKIWNFIKNDIAQILEAEILEGDPVIIQYSDGSKMYYKDNLLHRIGGPAVERGDGSWEYYYKGERHRVDGPATSGGDFYVEGKYYWKKDEFIEASSLWIQEHRDYQIDTIIGNEG